MSWCLHRGRRASGPVSRRESGKIRSTTPSVRAVSFLALAMAGLSACSAYATVPKPGEYDSLCEYVQHSKFANADTFREFRDDVTSDEAQLLDHLAAGLDAIAAGRADFSELSKSDANFRAGLKWIEEYRRVCG